MKDPFKGFPCRLQYQFPLTDDGKTWNGKLLVLSESVGKKVIEFAATQDRDGKTVHLKLSSAK